MNEQVAQSEEAFVRAMEHEPEPVEAQKPVYREYTFSISRSLFRIDGMAHSVMEVVSKLAGKVRSLADPDRAPKDYVESDFERGVRAASRNVAYNNGDAAPDRGNGEKRLLSWILGVVATLLAGGIFGGVAMYGKLSSIEKGQDGHEQRINRLEADRDQRYRSSQPAPP